MTSNDTHGDLSVLEAGGQNSTSKPRRALADVTILGMRLCRRRSTDAEYVESVRKAVMHSKWMAVVYGASAVLFFGASLGISYLVLRLVSELTPAEPGVDAVGPGLAVGLIFGALTGCLFVQGGSSFIQMLAIKQGQRTERLMLQFHDELKGSEKGTEMLDWKGEIRADRSA